MTWPGSSALSRAALARMRKSVAKRESIPISSSIIERGNCTCQRKPPLFSHIISYKVIRKQRHFLKIRWLNAPQDLDFSQLIGYNRHCQLKWQLAGLV